MDGWRPTKRKCKYKCLLPPKILRSMGGWRPTKHNYKNRTYIDAFFHQRKLRMWVDGVLLNTNTDIGRI